MSERDTDITEIRSSDRVDLDAAVDLEFESFQGFISEYSSNISAGGMFVTSENPPPVGTLLRFSLKLKGDFKLVQGRGEVIWVREQSIGSQGPAGMGIRFRDLEESSRDLIRRMVERHRAQGGVPFDIQNKDRGVDPVQTQDSGPIMDPSPSEEAKPRATLSELVSEVAQEAPGFDSVSGGEDQAPEIFVPPESLQAPSPPPRRSPEPMRASRKLRPGFVLSLLAAAAAGAVIFYFAQPLLPGYAEQELASGPDGVIDLPPPSALEAERNVSTQGDSVETISVAAEVASELSEGLPAGTAAEAAGEQPETSEPAVMGPPLTRVRLITWTEDSAADGTVVTLWGNGDLREEDLVRVRLGGGGGRELVKLKGVSWPFRDPVLQVGTGEVRRIRTGFHPKPGGNELHIVVDLQDPEVTLKQMERSDHQVLLFFRR